MEMHFGAPPGTQHIPAYLRHHCDKSHTHNQPLCLTWKMCFRRIREWGLLYAKSGLWWGILLFSDLPMVASLA